MLTQEQINETWTIRSDNYNRYVCEELDSDRPAKWLARIGENVPLDRPLRILDAGCGPGFFSVLLSGAGHIVTGIDGSDRMLSHAKENAEGYGVSPELVKGDFGNLPFADNTFDKITTVESFYFWPNPPENLKEVRRVLKPGGTFLLIAEIYGHDDLSAEVRENIKRYHLYNPTPETFETIFRDAGFPSVQVHIEKDHHWICIEGQKKR